MFFGVSSTHNINYTYDGIGQLTSAQGFESGGTTPRLQEQFGYAYDKAWNLNERTNNALIQSFVVNGLNELSSASETGTLTVAGSTTETGNFVTGGIWVNGNAANEYGDGTFALGGFTPTNGQNTYTAVAEDNLSRFSTNSVTVKIVERIESATGRLNPTIRSNSTFSGGSCSWC